MVPRVHQVDMQRTRGSTGLQPSHPRPACLLAIFYIDSRSLGGEIYVVAIRTNDVPSLADAESSTAEPVAH